MNSNQAVAGHRKRRIGGVSRNTLDSSHHFSTTLGSPFFVTSDIPTGTEFVDGTQVYVPYTHTITRPPSPTPTLDSASFSFIHPDPEIRRTPFKSILPRLWHVISPGMRTQHPFMLPHSSVAYNHQLSKSKGKVRNLNGLQQALPRQFNYSDLPPLDGEEGELVTVDDEACFFSDTHFGSGAATGIDILALLPTELSLYILSLLCKSNKSLSEKLSTASRATNLPLSETRDSLQIILTCLSVSRTWRALAADNTVWRSLFLSRWSVDLTRHGVSSFSRPSVQLSNWFPKTIYHPANAKSPTKGFRLKIRRKMHKGPPEAPESNSSPLSFRRPAHHSPSLPPSPIRGSTSTGLLPGPPIGHSASLQRSPSGSIIKSPKTQLTYAPLQLNWYALYRDRLELERRWDGSASAQVSFPLSPSESTRVRTSSSSTASSFSHVNLSVTNPSHIPTTTQTQSPVNPKTVPFAPQMLSISGHTDSVYCLEFDSRRIITGSRDRTIKVWSLRGKLLGSFGGAGARSSPGHGNNRSAVQGHTGSVLCLKFSPDWDRHGYDCQGGENCELAADSNRVTDDGERKKGFMVSGSSDCTVCVWDLYTGRKLERKETGSRLNDGKEDDEMEVHAEVRAVLHGHSGGVLDLRIDEKWIVSCSKDAVICVWNRETLELCRTLRGHEGPVNAVGLQNDKVVSASGDGKMILWDINHGERLRTFEGHDRGLACIEFKDDLIVSGSNDCKINVWSASTGACIRTLVGHEALVRALSFDPRNGRLVSGSYDKSVKIWDLMTGKLVREFKNIHTSHIFDVKFDAARIVSTSHDQKIVIMDFSSGLDTSIFV